MPPQLEALLRWIGQSEEALIYLALAAAAALENLIPPIPADTVVLFGGFLAGLDVVRAETVFVVVWLGNVSGALIVYALGRQYGPRFFSGRWGTMLLKPRQLASLSHFYRRYGTVVVFISRFLPVFRGIVPVFAGVSGIGVWRSAIPIAVASGIWYGALVYLGSLAGSNWEEILEFVNQSGRWLGALALLLSLVVAVWWWRSRREQASGEVRHDKRD